MSDRLAHLKQLLQELEGELQRADQLDPETTEMLAHVAEEISEAIDHAEPRRIQDRGLVSQLQERIETFEASHPTLTNLLSRLTDALSQWGI